MISAFETALGADFPTLPVAVRAAHRSGVVTHLRGQASVQGGSSPLASLIAHLFGVPAPASNVLVRVTMRLDADKEVWTRQFGARCMQSRLSCPRPGVVRESFGPFAFDMRVAAENGVLSMGIIGWRLGPIPLPAFLAPRSIATESVDEHGRFRFDVPIALPLIGRLTHYSGWLELEEVEASRAVSETEPA